MNIEQNDLLKTLGHKIMNDIHYDATVDIINNSIKLLPENAAKGNISDGYHTFDELYEFKKVYNVALFNEWGKQFDKNQEINIKDEQAFSSYRPLYSVHKSWRHNDGELCFGGEWFIVVAILPTGQISNHYEAKDWDLFKIPEVDKALYPFDNHTPQDVLTRLKNL